MKSVVTTPEIIGKPFPKLMINKYNNMVVLFSSQGIGTCVSVGNSIYELGSTSSTWDYPKFTDFNGTVTLSND